MSTLSDFSWAAARDGIQSFEYPPVIPGSLEAKANGSPKRGAQSWPDLQKQLLAARQEGQREGELRARAVFEESLRVQRESLQKALADFEAQRNDYFRRVEGEVVQLSLAIARKVLHREAQVDKQLLAGMVRALVGQLPASTGVVLRVAPSQQQEWIAFFAASELDPTPQIVSDPALAGDQCFLSTQLGSTEIGIETQLKEIENGLLDLLAQRPGA
jgi:flagellar assembly protein FliH